MKARWMKYLLCVLLGVLFAGAFAGTAAAQPSADGLEVHFMDIGRNDGILILCGGEAAFIDAGGYSRGVQAAKYMQQLGITSLKYYIGTHGHDDHVGGAPAILKAIDVGEVIIPHEGVKDAIYENTTSQREKEAVRAVEYTVIKPGEQISVGGATLTCLGPIKIVSVHRASGTENENSLILKLTYGETDILLSADATKNSLLASEKAYPGCLQAEVYKNAHHNQYTTREVFELIDPQYTVFSTVYNRMPEEKYLKLLNEFGSAAYATTPNHSGHVILRTDGENISFDTQYKAESMTFQYPDLEIYEGKSQKNKVSIQPSDRKKLLLYTSSDPSVASVDSEGKITGLKAGSAVITAKEASGVCAECVVTVKPAEVVFKKDKLTVKDGSKVSAGYSIMPSGTKAQITWASMDESIAAVDAKGRITGIYPGETVITAALPNGMVSEQKVEVTPVEVKSVSIKPSSVTMTIGDSRSVTASVSPSNATWQDIAWSSADESILTVTPDGMLSAVGVGKTKLTATSVNGKSKTVSVTVKPVYVKKIVPQSSTVELICGMEGFERAQLMCAVEPLNATIQTLEWSSSNKKIATVDENGVVTAVKNGSVTITCKAADGSGKYARIKVNVELPTEQIVLKASALEVYEGTSKTISATIEPRSKTKQLFYTSSDPEIAVVSSSGKVTGVKAGQAVIRVSDKTGVYAECTVTVSESTMKLKKTEMTVKDGSSASVSYSISPSGAKPAIVWASADESIASVSASGKVTGVYPGETTVTATMPGGQVHAVKVTVTPVPVSKVYIKPDSITMTIGDSRSVTASISPSNATWKDVEWSTADKSIVSITQDGMLTAVGVGTTKITATTAEGKSRTASVRVKPVYVKKITLSKPDIELIGGVNGRNQLQLSRVIEPANATAQDVTWSSSNKKIAVVDENGVVTGLKEGSVSITCKAADGSGRSAKIRLTFLENKMERTVKSVQGEMTVQASRIRYTDSGNVLEVRMRYMNRTGSAQRVPHQGFLVLITPDGEQIILKQIAGSQEKLSNGSNETFTYKIPVSTHPKLKGLDLTRCDAVMMTAQEAFAN